MNWEIVSPRNADVLGEESKPAFAALCAAASRPSAPTFCRSRARASLRDRSDRPRGGAAALRWTAERRRYRGAMAGEDLFGCRPASSWSATSPSFCRALPTSALCAATGRTLSRAPAALRGGGVLRPVRRRSRRAAGGIDPPLSPAMSLLLEPAGNGSGLTTEN